MRLIHTSDWHLGRTLHGVDLLAHQAAFLAWLLDLAVDRAASAVLVAGDVFDRAVPSADAVTVLDEALRAFATAGVPVVITSGNHDSAVRLGYASGLVEAAGIHLRTTVADLDRPVLLDDGAGTRVQVFGIPYLLPDAVMSELDAGRSHESVLKAAATRVHARAARQPAARTVVLAHAFVTGGTVSESERDIRVGGVADAPAAVFDGFDYVALGHLHGQQRVGPPTGTVARYSGSPLAFSFSERHHDKGVTVVEMSADGVDHIEHVSAPVPRPLVEVRGRLDDLLARADADLAALADAWVKVVLTDPVRPRSPMERLRERWPHTLVLDVDPDGPLPDDAADLRRVREARDPVALCTSFVAFTTGGAPDADESAVLRDAVEAATLGEGADR